MVQQPPSVRHVPVLLTAMAAIVVLVAVLGAAGVLEPPSTASASTELAQVPTGGDAAADGGDADGGDADATAEPTDAQTSAASTTGAASSTGAMSASGTAVMDRLVTATASLVAALAEPADDSATPGPVDSAQVPAAPIVEDPAAVPPGSGEGRRVVYSINGQRVWVVEADGTLTRTYPVSGRLDRPGPGRYEVYSKSPTAISYDSTERMQYLIRFAHGENAAIGFHDIPVLDDGTPAQTEEQLGQALSAGSVRQAQADAEFLWTWAAVGTTVVVVA